MGGLGRARLTDTL
jgi:hypothetical protein